VNVVTVGPWQLATSAELAALYRAVMLAPNIHTCEALLRGETVPLSKLDAEAVRRHGT
jgi:hypothetical protein